MGKLMLLRTGAAACLLLLLGATNLVRADDEEGGPLHDEMELMDDAFKPLYRAMRDPDPAEKAQYLEWLQTVQVHAVAAKVYEPAYLKELSEEERQKMLVSFRVDMASLIETLLKMEQAILKDDWEAAKGFASDLRGHRKEGHDTYDP